MIKITIEEFAKQYIKDNPDQNLEDITASLEKALKSKQNGACCIHCGRPIWAIGTAVVGFNGCFTCITGESDASEDYEVY